MKTMFMRFIFFLTLCVFLFWGCNPKNESGPEKGSVIFIHPDGSSASMWGALRLIQVGPDGYLNWDKMSNLGIYRGHLRNSTNSSSNGGATVHAFGVKGTYELYGIDPRNRFKSLSGKYESIMTEAKNAGKSIALINSGHICEPGTGVFLANAEDRSHTDTISWQIITGGADIIFSGGEELLLPEGVTGRHGQPGVRKDNKNLIEEAEKEGYQIIYTRDELLNLSKHTPKVLGIFASGHTFNDRSEEELLQRDLPPYNPEAPTVAEMTHIALEILKNTGKEFLVVVEEEGSDNFANDNNASGALEALRRADEAIGVVMHYIEQNPNTLLLTTADSDAGSMAVVSVHKPHQFDQPLPAVMSNGAPLDGQGGTATPAFVTKEDQFGNRLYFGISWACYADVAGGIIAKAHGLNAHMLPQNVDNTDIYRMLYMTLFGVDLKNE